MRPAVKTSYVEWGQPVNPGSGEIEASLLCNDGDVMARRGTRGQMIMRSLILCELKQKFSGDECACLISIASDLYNDADYLLRFYMTARQRAVQYCREWNVAPGEFVGKINSLTPIEIFVLIDAVTRFVQRSNGNVAVRHMTAQSVGSYGPPAHSPKCYDLDAVTGTGTFGTL